MPRSKNNRKRKNKVYHPVQPNMNSLRPSNTHLQRMREAGIKLLRLAGADTSFIDRMSKNQQKAIFSSPIEKPRVGIEPGAHVPRTYVRFIHSELNYKLEHHYLKDDAEVALTLADTVTYGIAFYNGLRVYPEIHRIVLGEVDAVKAAVDKIDESGLLGCTVRDQVTQLLMFPLMTISQVQFRLYGILGGYKARQIGMGLRISLLSYVPECITFKHFGRARKAYKLCTPAPQTAELIPAEIPYSAIFPLCREEDDRKLSIYIQQHAILRLKERLQIFPPTERIKLLYSSLLLEPTIVRGPDDQPLFAAHICKEEISYKKEIFGYFSFVTQGDKLFILTFLPLTSALTPEGKRLRKALHLSKQDITYLKMDSLNFLFDLDLEQIPLLKNALIQSGIYKIREAVNKARHWNVGPPPPPILPNEKQTAFVKKYIEEHPANNPNAPEAPEEV
jgi:hypothetical protein